MLSASDLDPDPDADQPVETTVETLNTRALIGLIVSLTVGVAGLFVLPALQSAFGLTFGVAFGLILAVELLSFVGVAVSIFRLYQTRTFG
ncbi:hypothetical protein [Haloglomus irregulare]|uniref:hypothetical protein n=1 Tax=Haloglomus irregulare TaxID=2234134 RepID=UPI00192DA944|nr:hypothetical protein [Haloglomus irregulare]